MSAMGKKAKAVLAVLVLAALAVFLAAEGAEAFCVYNKTDYPIQVHQVSGHKTGKGFTKLSLQSGDSACCHWSNKDCNKKGKKDSIVKFDARYYDGVREHGQCDDFPIKAGGWLTVRGTYPHYTCEAHY
jgi:hypothetical protein